MDFYSILSKMEIMDFYSILSKMDGNSQFGLRISGDNGWGSNFDQEHTVKIIRGDAKIIERTSGENGHGNCATTQYCILPLSPLVAIEEYNCYSDSNGRRNESIAIHLWTVSTGWRSHKKKI